MKEIHQSTISFNTEAAICARYIEDSDVDNNESLTLSTMIGNICESITSTSYIGLITTSAEEGMEDGISQDGEHHIQSLDIVSNDIPILYDENDLTHTTHDISSLEIDHSYRYCNEENDKDNTHEYGIDRSMYARKDNDNGTIVRMVGNILKCNDSPRKSDGRGVSTEGFKGYASNLIGLKRYLVLAGINRTTTRIAHNSLI